MAIARGAACRRGFDDELTRMGVRVLVRGLQGKLRDPWGHVRRQLRNGGEVERCRLEGESRGPAVWPWRPDERPAENQDRRRNRRELHQPSHENYNTVRLTPRMSNPSEGATLGTAGPPFRRPVACVHKHGGIKD